MKCFHIFCRQPRQALSLIVYSAYPSVTSSFSFFFVEWLRLIKNQLLTLLFDFSTLTYSLISVLSDIPLKEKACASPPSSISQMDPLLFAYLDIRGDSNSDVPHVSSSAFSFLRKTVLPVGDFLRDAGDVDFISCVETNKSPSTLSFDTALSGVAPGNAGQDLVG